MTSIQVETHVVFPLWGVATQPTLESRGQLNSMCQHNVWQMNKIQVGITMKRIFYNKNDEKDEVVFLHQTHTLRL